MNNLLQIKMCGANHINTITQAKNIDLDYLGLIFYSQSERCFKPTPEKLTALKNLPKSIKKVGVFVNEKEEYIKKMIEEFELDIVQLHGMETPEFTEKITKTIPVIKTFHLRNELPVEKMKAHNCSLFLFDTAGGKFGGNGVKFNWNTLENYKLETPFLLSGGINKNDCDAILNINHPKLLGVDINSKFELSPGEKNMKLVNEFVNTIKHKEYA